MHFKIRYHMNIWCFCQVLCAMLNWAQPLQNRGVTTPTCWRPWDPYLPSYGFGLNLFSSGLCTQFCVSLCC